MIRERIALRILRQRMEGLAALATTYGVVAIFVIMLLKDVGVPVPIPSDLLMVGAGVQLAAGAYGPLELFAAIAVATAIGSSVQFAIARTVSRIAAGGARAVFIGLNVPGARAGVIPAAGVARMGYARFAVAAFGGSFVFYGWHVA